VHLECALPTADCCDPTLVVNKVCERVTTNIAHSLQCLVYVEEG